MRRLPPAHFHASIFAITPLLDRFVSFSFIAACRFSPLLSASAMPSLMLPLLPGVSEALLAAASR